MLNQKLFWCVNMLEPLRLSELEEKVLQKFIRRNKQNLQNIKDNVLEILEEVRKNGDKALIKYTKIYDGVKLSPNKLKVSEDEILQAYREVPKSLIKAIKEASKNLKEVHEKQLPNEKILKKTEGVYVKEVFKPLESVGLYVPGGRVPYPSTVLMLGVPAKVAGVKKIVVCTPPGKDGKINPAILVASDMVGVDEIYRVGGVQAIGALAYGTRTIPKVDKIVGPGNIYVTTAKTAVYGEVGIDFPAGPTEIMVFADETAKPNLVVVDLLSQAEHDPLAVPILVTTSEELAFKVREKILTSFRRRLTKKTIKQSIKKHAAILIAKNEEEAINFINKFAPEHLEIMTKNPEKIIPLINNVGSISLGKYTPVAVVDYAVGISHVLPTGGAASFHSGLSVYDFLKVVHVQKLTKEGLQKMKNVVEVFSKIEGLDWHEKSVKERLKGR